ncbi:alpha-glucosidase/alpha-galactosidase [Pseudonocardia sp. MH-G8]|uniref:alpha-glucosidase/alpha-galactosidase n=1 Tax=Pseudonocardia sp. MH-G8 TaxID=1854588 RepID=UPI000BA08BB4|nr:alpha-glucosidase/alpha-galactosidase [Pseudonocardia sp. MH-G8]OZM80116.1 alpha-glucosidase/alpha-galactosidase [Pseudonocardia sp. MH-G8]
MPKITIVGAGGYVFPFRLIGDLLSFPALRDSVFTLMDIDADRLERTASAARALVAHHGFPTTVESTTDRRAALDGADYVIITFQVGGIDAFRDDVEIPRRYGLDQTVGDTLGPGGVFRFLRSVVAYREIAADLAELAPGAQVINYANPMAMATWYLNAIGARTVGLCHSVQGTSRMLARELDVPYEEVRFRAGGVNHQSWFTEFRRGDEDLYPRLREVMGAKHLHGPVGELAADHGDHSGADRGASVYEGGNERVRTAIMEAFGYFHTESSHHASEYLPYFRKSPGLVHEFLPERWDYYDICRAHDEQGQTDKLLGELKAELAPSVEYGAAIVNSMETGAKSVIHGNVPNTGLVTNLPEGSCVEVACLVDGNGVQPTVFGALPPQCAAVNRTGVNVQELAVTAALTGRREHVYHAVMADPLSGALLTLDQIHAMVDELFLAHKAYLPAELQG